MDIDRLINPPLQLVKPEESEVLALASMLVKSIRRRRGESREAFIGRVVAAYRDAENRLSYKPIK